MFRMTKRVQINNIDHADLKVAIAYGADHGDSVNQMLIFPTEFEEVAREYPILFGRDDNGDYQSLALLGLDRDENLFLAEDGWLGRYVPAVQQRGPFSIGLVKSEVSDVAEDALIHVDMDDPRVGEGLPLFLEHGGNAPYLDHIAGVLRVIHQGIELTAPMFAAFEQFGLIRPVTVQVRLSETEQYDIPDRFTIGQDCLAGLHGEALEQLHGQGFLRAAFAVAWSLGNVSRLIDLKNRKRAAA